MGVCSQVHAAVMLYMTNDVQVSSELGGWVGPRANVDA